MRWTTCTQTHTGHTPFLFTADLYKDWQTMRVYCVKKGNDMKLYIIIIEKKGECLETEQRYYCVFL